MVYCVTQKAHNSHREKNKLAAQVTCEVAEKIDNTAKNVMFILITQLSEVWLKYILQVITKVSLKFQSL